MKTFFIENIRLFLKIYDSNKKPPCIDVYANAKQLDSTFLRIIIRIGKTRMSSDPYIYRRYYIKKLNIF